jgi:hypothetical protein
MDRGFTVYDQCTAFVELCWDTLFHILMQVYSTFGVMNRILRDTGTNLFKMYTIRMNGTPIPVGPIVITCFEHHSDHHDLSCWY